MIRDILLVVVPLMIGIPLAIKVQNDWAPRSVERRKAKELKKQAQHLAYWERIESYRNDPAALIIYLLTQLCLAIGYLALCVVSGVGSAFAGSVADNTASEAIEIAYRLGETVLLFAALAFGTATVRFGRRAIQHVIATGQEPPPKPEPEPESKKLDAVQKHFKEVNRGRARTQEELRREDHMEDHVAEPDPGNYEP